MSDTAAPAPAEQSVVPKATANDAAVERSDDLPKAGGNSTPDTTTDEVLSTEEAIARAMEGDQPKAKPAKPAEKPAQDRSADGKYAAKDKPQGDTDKPAPDAATGKSAPEQDASEQPAKPRTAAPSRFSEAAKAEWHAVAEPVQHEVVRMQRELEAGLKEYQTRDEPIKPFRDMAERAGTTLDAALKNYVAAEQALTANPTQALMHMAETYVPGGIEAFVRHLLGEQQPASNPEITALRQQVVELTQASQRTNQAMEQQVHARAVAESEAVVAQFTAANPRASEPEVEAQMIRLLQSGYIPSDLPHGDRLSQAYDAATRLIPVRAAQPAPAPSPQTRQEPTSLSGAPERGSSPRQDEVLSTDEAIERAYRGR